jgi:hypothetical protein
LATTEVVNVPSQGSKALPTTETASMESKIVEEQAEPTVLSYDQLGRGLVYNCKDKYWACVDKESYINCGKSMKLNKSKGKPIFCAVSNIYNSEEDCGKIQKHYVSTSQSTDFCK